MVYSKNYIISILLLFTLSCCTPLKNEIEPENYSICLGEFIKYEDADLFKSKLDFELWDKLRILTTEDKYFLIYGNFESSFDAGKKAFELFRRALISNYKIYYKEKYVYDNYSNILIIGRYQGRPSIYSYNIAAKQTKLFWSRWGRKIVTLNHYKDRSFSFFVTALGYGKQGSFPYVRDARIYLFSGADEKVNEIDELGDGLQVYTYWDAKDTFKVNITKPDSIKSELLIQKIYSFNHQGKVGGTKTRTFNITTDGFPKPPSIQPQLVSNNNKQFIRIAELDSESYIYLKKIEERSESMVANFKGSLLNAIWSNDDKFLFITVKSKSRANRTITNQQELMIIDTDQKKLLKTFYSNYYQNILANGNYLFYETIIDGESAISVYDVLNDDIYDVIKMPGGCAINNLVK
jgi:hypothetical protein